MVLHLSPNLTPLLAIQTRSLLVQYYRDWTQKNPINWSSWIWCWTIVEIVSHMYKMHFKFTKLIWSRIVLSPLCVGNGFHRSLSRGLSYLPLFGRSLSIVDPLPHMSAYLQKDHNLKAEQGWIQTIYSHRISSVYSA
jgi:hypothetical protein